MPTPNRHSQTIPFGNRAFFWVRNAGRRASILVLPWFLALGCGGNGQDEWAIADTPKAAATQIESAFASAPDAYRNAAKIASDSLSSGDYDKALEALQVIRASENVTLEQGLAVHSSMVALERSLVAAAEAGDQAAEETYTRLKRMKQR